jgi:hypothetical protein
MTDEEHQQFREAMLRRRERLRADPEACKQLLIKLGIWHLGVPIKSAKKSTKKSTKPSRSAARKK